MSALVSDTIVPESALRRCAKAFYRGGGVLRDCRITVAADSFRTIPAGQLRRQEEVFALDMPSDLPWGPCPNEIRTVDVYYRQRLVELWTAKGHFLRVAPDQFVWSPQGLVRADELRPGIYVMLSDLRLDQIERVKLLPYSAQYWTLRTNVGNWFANRILLCDSSVR